MSLWPSRQGGAGAANMSDGVELRIIDRLAIGQKTVDTATQTEA